MGPGENERLSDDGRADSLRLPLTRASKARRVEEHHISHQRPGPNHAAGVSQQQFQQRKPECESNGLQLLAAYDSTSEEQAAEEVREPAGQEQQSLNQTQATVVAKSRMECQRAGEEGLEVPPDGGLVPGQQQCLPSSSCPAPARREGSIPRVVGSAVEKLDDGDALLDGHGQQEVHATGDLLDELGNSQSLAVSEENFTKQRHPGKQLSEKQQQQHPLEKGTGCEGLFGKKLSDHKAVPGDVDFSATGFAQVHISEQTAEGSGAARREHVTAALEAVATSTFDGGQHSAQIAEPPAQQELLTKGCSCLPKQPDPVPHQDQDLTGERQPATGEGQCTLEVVPSRVRQEQLPAGQPMQLGDEQSAHAQEASAATEQPDSGKQQFGPASPPMPGLGSGADLSDDQGKGKGQSDVYGNLGGPGKAMGCPGAIEEEDAPASAQQQNRAAATETPQQEMLREEHQQEAANLVQAPELLVKLESEDIAPAKEKQFSGAEPRRRGQRHTRASAAAAAEQAAAGEAASAVGDKAKCKAAAAAAGPALAGRPQRAAAANAKFAISMMGPNRDQVMAMVMYDLWPTDEPPQLSPPGSSGRRGSGSVGVAVDAPGSGGSGGERPTKRTKQDGGTVASAPEPSPGAPSSTTATPSEVVNGGAKRGCKTGAAASAGARAAEVAAVVGKKRSASGAAKVSAKSPKLDVAATPSAKVNAFKPEPAAAGYGGIKSGAEIDGHDNATATAPTTATASDAPKKPHGKPKQARDAGGGATVRAATRVVRGGARHEVAERGELVEAHGWQDGPIKLDEAQVDFVRELCRSIHRECEPPPVNAKALLRCRSMLGKKVEYRKRDGSGKHLPVHHANVMERGKVACLCSICNGQQCFSLTEFEVHCGGANKKPAEHTFVTELRLNLRDLGTMACRCLGTIYGTYGAGPGGGGGGAVRSPPGSPGRATGQHLKPPAAVGPPVAAPAAVTAATGTATCGSPHSPPAVRNSAATTRKDAIRARAAAPARVVTATEGSGPGAEDDDVTTETEATETETETKTTSHGGRHDDGELGERECDGQVADSAQRQAASEQGPLSTECIRVSGGSCTACRRALPPSYKELASKTPSPQILHCSSCGGYCHATCVNAFALPASSDEPSWQCPTCQQAAAGRRIKRPNKVLMDREIMGAPGRGRGRGRGRGVGRPPASLGIIGRGRGRGGGATTAAFNRAQLTEVYFRKARVAGFKCDITGPTASDGGVTTSGGVVAATGAGGDIEIEDSTGVAGAADAPAAGCSHGAQASHGRRSAAVVTKQEPDTAAPRAIAIASRPPVGHRSCRWEADYYEEEDGEEGDEPAEEEEDDDEDDDKDSDDEDYSGNERRRKRTRGAPTKLAFAMPPSARGGGSAAGAGGGGRIQMSLPISMRASAARTSQRRPIRSRTLFDGKPGGLQDGERVHYTIQGQRLLSGTVVIAERSNDSGILCDCCSKVISASAFESHAGHKHRRNPYESILTNNGTTLKRIAERIMPALPTSLAAAEPTASTAAPTGNASPAVPGGPKPTAPSSKATQMLRTHYKAEGGHKSTAMASTQQQFARISSAVAAAAAAAGLPHVEGVSSGLEGSLGRGDGGMCGSDSVTHAGRDEEHASETLAADLASSCVLCHQPEFDREGFSDQTVLICDQCEKEYHIGCLREHKMVDMQAVPEGEWFCSDECMKIRQLLTDALEQGENIMPGNPAYRWQFIRGRDGTKATARALKTVLEILQESFDPIIDNGSGEDLLPRMVHAESAGDYDFQGMYAILLRYRGADKEARGRPVLAALVRVLGSSMAEIPLVATRYDCRRQGHLRALVEGLRHRLIALGVRAMVLPATADALPAWRQLSFMDLDEGSVRVARGEQRMIIFPHTSVVVRQLIRVPDHESQQLPSAHQAADPAFVAAFIAALEEARHASNLEVAESEERTYRAM
ncbi:hypothetical protein VaNZ11_003959, partial [Volvox africanus]